MMTNLKGNTKLTTGCNWSCKNEDLGLSCGNCQSCILSSKLLQTTEWFLKAGEMAKKQFLSGVLSRCENSGILESIGNVLNVTMGKDFTYARSRLKPGLAGDASHCNSSRALDPKRLRDQITQTWDWFRESSNWIKSNYLLGILSLCDTELLHVLGNLARVLLVREKTHVLTFRPAVDGMEDATELASIPESHYSFSSERNPDLELLICANSVYGAVDLPYYCQDDDAMETTVDTGCGTLTTMSASRYKKSISGYGSSYATSGYEGEDASDSESACEDPALTVVPKSFRSFSGVGRHRDFVRQLPVHIGKRILGLLDSTSLLCCLKVSQHWKYLAIEVQQEARVKNQLKKKAMFLQGKTKAVNPTFARFQEVLVAVRNDEKFIYHCDASSRSRKDRAFEAVYSGVITKTITLEERNVFCGAYNILQLQSREDPSRVIHYGGGQLVVVGSKDRVVRLVDVVSQKEVLPAMHGHAGSIRAVLVCEERGLVFSAGYDLSIRSWNLKTGACTTLFRGHMGTINCLDLYGDRLVSGAKDCKVKVWDLSGKCDASLRFKHSQPVLCVKIDKFCVLSSCAEGLVKMWSLETASLLKVIESHKGPVGCLFLSEWHILTGGADGQVIAWSTNAEFKKCLMTYQHPMEVLSVKCLYLRAISGCADGKIRIFNFVTGDCLKVIKACGQNSPVHSIYVTENNIVVDTEAGIFLLQFPKVCWDYTSSSEYEIQDEASVDSEETAGGLRRHSDAYVRAKRMSLIGSSSQKLFPHVGQSSQGLSHDARSLSALAMQHAREIQQESMRQGTWSPLQTYRHTRAYMDLQPEFMPKGPPTHSSGRPTSGHSHAANHVPSTGISDTGKGREPSLMNSELSRSEKALLRRVQARGAHRPATPKRMLLRLGSSSQLCPLAEPLRANMELNARVRDAWGSPPPPTTPPPPLSAPAKPKADPRPDLNLDTAAISTASILVPVSGKASSPPPLVESHGQADSPRVPHPRIYRNSNVIYSPLAHLATQTDPHLSSDSGRGHRPAQGRKVRSCMTSPALPRSEVKGQQYQRKRPQTAGTAGAAARKVMTPSSPPAQVQCSTPVQRPSPSPHSLLRTPTAPSPSLAAPPPPRSAKSPGRHVEFEVPPKTLGAHHNPLDPFREHGGFQLRTDTQLEEYVRQETRRAQSEHARAEAQRPRAAAHYPRRRKTSVWRLRVKGLPYKDFTKEDQVYAPELGPDVYI